VARKIVEVGPRKGPEPGWTVSIRGQGAQQNYTTKDPAVDAGRQIAKAAPDGGQLVIKKENGRIQTEHTYKKDPHPPKG
jgi:uncharacterized protein YcnI